MQESKSSYIAHIFRLTAEITSIILIMGFIVSEFLNSLIFNAWGLTFNQTAGTSDVVMSGLTFALDFLPLLIGLPIFYFLFLSWDKIISKIRQVILSKFSTHDSESNLERYSDGFIYSAQSFILFISIINVIQIATIFILNGILDNNFGFDAEQLTTFAIFSFFFFSILLIFSIKNFKIDRYLFNLLSILSISFHVFTFLWSIDRYFQIRIIDGYLNTFTIATGRVAGCQKDYNQVLWHGSDRIVIRCIDTNYIKVLNSNENVVIAPQPHLNKVCVKENDFDISTCRNEDYSKLFGGGAATGGIMPPHQQGAPAHQTPPSQGAVATPDDTTDRELGVENTISQPPPPAM